MPRLFAVNAPVANFAPRILAVALPWVLVILLVCSNIATLLSAKIHRLAFQALESVATTVAGASAEAILSRSPSRVAAQESRALARASTVARGVAKRTTVRLAAHAAESVSTVPARVLPWIGAGAVIGMTAFDVRNDCTTVTELNDLLEALGIDREDSGLVCGYVAKIPSADAAWQSAKANATGLKARILELVERIRDR